MNYSEMFDPCLVTEVRKIAALLGARFIRITTLKLLESSFYLTLLVADNSVSGLHQLALICSLAHGGSEAIGGHVG